MKNCAKSISAAVCRTTAAFCIGLGASHCGYPESNFALAALVNGGDAGAIATVQGSSHTSESGGFVVVKIHLSTMPSSEVTLRFTVSDPLEARTDVSMLTFTRENWDSDQTVIVTGVDDFAPDGNQPFTVPIVMESMDALFNGLASPDAQLVNDDDDIPGFIVFPASGLQTTEGGGQATFKVRLKIEPAFNVTMPTITSSDLAEGTVAPGALTFTPTNWFTDQTVTLTGVNDAVADGNISYAIAFGAAVSADLGFNGLIIPSVSVVNMDDDVSGITVTPIADLFTTEAGGTAVFNVSLNTPPCCGADVTMALSTTKPTEGTPSTLLLTLNAVTMNQNVTVTGMDDALKDGNTPYAIILNPSASADPMYDGIDPPDVSLTNLDNEKYAFITAKIFGGGMAGVAGADSKCMSDKNRVSPTTYKALVATAATRIACTTANCGGGAGEHTNWALAPSTVYFRADALTPVVTTNANGVFVFGALVNAFGTAGQFWTGLNADWTTAANTCTNWSSGRAGSATAVTSLAINNALSLCSSGRQPLLCVEQ